MLHMLRTLRTFHIPWNRDQNTAATLLHFILGHFCPGSLSSSRIDFIFVLRKPLYYLVVFGGFLHL